MSRTCAELLNSTDQVFNTPTTPLAYVLLGFVHIAGIIIPALTAVLIAYNLVSRLSDHPSKLIFKWICILCLVCPCTYALLMDLSLIFDMPLIGRCERKWEGALYWFAHSIFETSLLWIFAFNPVMLYVSICRNTTNFSKKKINAFLVGIMIIATLESAIWVFLTESYITTRCKVRGSFCLVVFEGPAERIATMEYVRILIGVLPVLILVPMFLVLYWHKVKNSVRHFNRSLAHSIVNVSVSLLLGTFLWNLPTMLIHFSTYHGSQRTFASLVTTYTLQLNFVLYPLLIIALHKDLRDSIVQKFRQCRSILGLRSTGVQPITEVDDPHVILQPFQPGMRGVQAHPPGHPQPHPPGYQQPHPQVQAYQQQQGQQPHSQGQQPRPQGQQPRPQGQPHGQQPRPQGQPCPQAQQPRPQDQQQGQQQTPQPPPGQQQDQQQQLQSVQSQDHQQLEPQPHPPESTDKIPDPKDPKKTPLPENTQPELDDSEQLEKFQALLAPPCLPQDPENTESLKIHPDPPGIILGQGIELPQPQGEEIEPLPQPQEGILPEPRPQEGIYPDPPGIILGQGIELPQPQGEEIEPLPEPYPQEGILPEPRPQEGIHPDPPGIILGQDIELPQPQGEKIELWPLRDPRPLEDL